MTSIATLKRSASEATKWRGHRMGRWVDTISAHKSASLRECLDCGAYVMVDTRPMPNGIGIGGSAVAINCGDDPC